MLGKYDYEEKSRCLDEILIHYFNRNFGTMSKADLEILLFHILLEYKREKEPELCSDYELSNVLGISQARIRNLKQRVELVYPRENFSEMWKEYFAGYIKYAKYDEHTGLVKMNIPDVAVMVELRNFMEINSWYNEYQLNPKLFQCPLSIFIELCQKIDGEEVTIDRETKKKLKELEKTLINFDEKNAINLMAEGNVKEGFIKLGSKISESLLTDLLGIVPFGTTVKMLYEALVK